MPLRSLVVQTSRLILSVLALQYSVSAFAQTDAKEPEEETPKKQSVFFPDWSPAATGYSLRPVLGFQYLSLPKTSGSAFQSNAYVVQGEIGAHVGLRGIPLIPGNPGMQIEPAVGYAVGQAFVKESGKSVDSGTYDRMWGALRTPIYYKFLRQVFEGRYGQVTGGPLPVMKRSTLISDTGIAVLPLVSAHYTLTHERAYGDKAESPEIKSYDHWLHGRLSTSVLDFYVDVGPGYSTSESVYTESTAGKINGKTSSTYLLGLSGFDLIPNKIGFEASAKYMFSSETDVKFVGSFGRSPLEDLGAQAARAGLPADSLYASAFFGIRRLVGAFGFGWRYSLEILNFSETNNTKQQKRETNGIGIDGSFSF